MLNSTYSEACTLYGISVHEPANASQLDSLSKSFREAISVIQFTISVLGIVGNILSLVVLINTKSLHTLPNLYIGGLAVVDLIICLIIPVNTVQIIIQSDSHTIPAVLCKIIGK